MSDHDDQQENKEVEHMTGDVKGDAAASKSTTAKGQLLARLRELRPRDGAVVLVTQLVAGTRDLVSDGDAVNYYDTSLVRRHRKKKDRPREEKVQVGREYLIREKLKRDATFQTIDGVVKASRIVGTETPTSEAPLVASQPVEPRAEPTAEAPPADPEPTPTPEPVEPSGEQQSGLVADGINGCGATIDSSEAAGDQAVVRLLPIEHLRPEGLSQLQLFDYTQLDQETRLVVQQKTGEIRSLMRRAAQDIVDIGLKLIDVKARLGHGHYLPWLRAEFDWSEASAVRFMQVGEQFKSINDARRTGRAGDAREGEGDRGTDATDEAAEGEVGRPDAVRAGQGR